MELALRTRLEPVANRGNIAMYYLIADQAGSFLGYLFDLIFYDHEFGWGENVVITVKTCAWIVALVPPIMTFPFIYFYEETATPPKVPVNCTPELVVACE